MPIVVYTKTRMCAKDTYDTLKKNLERVKDTVPVFRFSRANIVKLFEEGDFITAALQDKDLKACRPVLYTEIGTSREIGRMLRGR